MGVGECGHGRSHVIARSSRRGRHLSLQTGCFRLLRGRSLETNLDKTKESLTRKARGGSVRRGTDWPSPHSVNSKLCTPSSLTTRNFSLFDFGLDERGLGKRIGFDDPRMAVQGLADIALRAVLTVSRREGSSVGDLECCTCREIQSVWTVLWFGGKVRDYNWSFHVSVSIPARVFCKLG